MKESSTFCIYPWDHLATLTNGRIVPCCVAEDDGSMSLHQQSFKEAWNSQTMKNIRKKMLAGEKVKACSRCYDEEACGIVSHRVQSNTFYKNLLGSFDSLIESTSSDGHYSGPIKSVDLRLGNNCNLKCVMCRPWESSKWAAEINKMIENTDDKVLLNDFSWKSKLNKQDFLWHKNPKFWETFQEMIPDMRDMIIGGGEPFLIAEQIAFLKECVARGHSKYLTIRFHTNGTILPEGILELLAQFRHIDFMVSIDGYDQQNYYMRYPATWRDILTNLNKLDETPNNIVVYILSTMHAMSIYYFPEFLKWFMQQKFKKIAVMESSSNLPVTGIVHNPSYINPRVLPKKIKQTIRSRYNDLYSNEFADFFKETPELKKNVEDRLNANLDYMDSEDKSAEFVQFKSYIKALDKTRNTDFSKTFPALHKEISSLE